MKTPKILLLTLATLAIVMTTGLAYGATNSTSTGPLVTSTLSLTDIVVGAFSAAVYAGLGYYTDLSKNPGESFNPKQFMVTVAIGGALGLFVPITQPTDLSGLASAGLTAFTSFGAIYFIQKLLSILNAFHVLGKTASTTTTPTTTNA